MNRLGFRIHLVQTRLSSPFLKNKKEQDGSSKMLNELGLLFDGLYNAAAHYLQLVAVFATCQEDRAKWESSFLSCKQQFQDIKALYLY